jgi:hypothetical protein
VVKNWPLALCDARSVQQTDLVAADFVRQTYIGETLYMLPNPEHKWHYLSKQAPNEVTLLKIYDSERVEGKRTLLFSLRFEHCANILKHL